MRIPIRHLKSYSQALAQYHLHPEDKFQNGDFTDRGITRRRHVQVSGIEFIGKESNKATNGRTNFTSGSIPTRKSITDCFQLGKVSFLNHLICSLIYLGNEIWQLNCRFHARNCPECSRVNSREYRHQFWAILHVRLNDYWRRKPNAMKTMQE